MNVQIFDLQEDLQILPDKVTGLVKAVIQNENHPCEEVSVYFVTKDKISRLHEEYFNDPTPTDCISFPMESDPRFPYRILGDVFVCPRTAIEYCQDHDRDPYRETTLYIVHGLLHLLGYDDIGDPEPEMRKAETRHMTMLEKNRLLLTSQNGEAR